MSNVSGIENTNLGMEPYQGSSENIDVVFVEDNHHYTALVNDGYDYVEESIPMMDSQHNSYLRIENRSPYKIADGDYATQFYLGAISVVGLFILFRMMQKSKI